MIQLNEAALIQRLFWVAIIAGLVGGVGVSVLHLQAMVPLILEAETFERAQNAGEAAGLAEPWQPDDGFERTAFTVLANLVMGVGFSMLLIACFALRWRPVNAFQGLLWGLAGFATFFLAPAAGLPPELPGVDAPDLFGRQVWWLGTVAATGGGLALVAFGPRAIQLVGLVVIFIPHVVEAPRSEAPVSTVPAELAAKFVGFSSFSAAVLWLLLGGVGGWLYQRWILGREAA